MVALGSELVDPVDVEWHYAMLFVNRQVHRPPINLARTGKHYFHMRIEHPARFKQNELCRAVQLQVTSRIEHRFDMADTTRKIEDVIHSANQVVDDRTVT